MSNQAWVTLATNDSYGLGALVLAHSLRRAGSAYPAAVLITPAVTEAMRERLNAVFAEVITVDVLDSRDSAHLALLQRPELGITFTKLHCWSLTQYDKCVFLDADTLIVQNCDELFEREELSAAPDVGWPDCFNSGVFVFVPSLETYSRLLTFAQERGSFDGGDQGLLNAFFSDWAHGDINKHLPFLYNVTSAAFYSYLPALKHYGENLKIIHFIGATKPWLQQYNWQSHSVDAPEHIRELLQLWWDLFVGQVHTQLDTAMEARSATEDIEAVKRPAEAEIPLEPPQDTFSLYAPRLDAESEFTWHHPKSKIPETEAQDHSINMSDIYDPWKHYKGNIPPWNANRTEEPVNYVWDYLQQQETNVQSWQQTYNENSHEERQQKNTPQEHYHFTHSNHNWNHNHTQHNIDYLHHENTHDSSRHREHHAETRSHQHTNTHQHDHEHQSHHESQQSHQSHHDSFHHSSSVQTENKQGSSLNDIANYNQHYHSNNSDHSHHNHEFRNEVYQSHHHESPSQDKVDQERNENHDHGHPHPEAHIVSGDSHKHSQNRFHHHHQDHGIRNHTHQKQRHKTKVYRIHLDLKKQRRRQILGQIRDLANATAAVMNGNGHAGESESEDDDFIPRHPYDGFYLRHISTIDPRGRKICTHEIPPTPLSSPLTTPRPGSPDEENNSPVVSDYDTASENCDDTGVAGNLAKVVPGATEFQREAIDELSRRQGWEAGNIDYMGADSFANIWAKISQTLNQAPKQPSPPRKEPTPPKDIILSEPVKELAPEAANKTVEAPTEIPTAPSNITDTPSVIVIAQPSEKLSSETVSVTETPQTEPEKTESVPPTPKSTPEPPSPPVTEPAPKAEAVDAPVTEIIKTEAPKESPVCTTVAEVPKIESQPAASVPKAKAQTEAVAQVESKKEVPVEAPKETPAKAPKETPVKAPKETPVEAPKETPVEAPKETPVEAPKETPVEAPKETPVEAPKETPVEATKKTPVEASKETPVEAPKKTPVEASKETPVEAPKETPVEALKETPEVGAEAALTKTAPLCEAPSTEATPEKASQCPIMASTDSPPLANTPAKDEPPSVPAAKLEERRKPVAKLQLSVPTCADPLATPDSEQEDAASLAQSIIASELRATVTAATPSSDVPTPRLPLQEQRLSVDEPEVPTPPVSLAQIGVKPKGKPTTAALIESSVKPEVKESPSDPSTPDTPTTPSETPKKKVTKKVSKVAPPAGSGDAPVPPPRKKEKKPKEK